MKNYTLVIGFLIMIMGCEHRTDKTQDMFPGESFQIIEDQIEGYPAVGSINMEYKAYDRKEKFPWCLIVTISLNVENLYENGLPKAEERIIVDALEDELLGEIKKLTTTHYIGHLFNNTFLTAYFYLEEPAKVHKFLEAKTQDENQVREFAYEIHKDSGWDIVEPLF